MYSKQIVAPTPCRSMTTFANVADLPLRHWFEASQANVGAVGYSRIGSIMTVSIEARHHTPSLCPFFMAVFPPRLTNRC